MRYEEKKHKIKIINNNVEYLRGEISKFIYPSKDTFRGDSIVKFYYQESEWETIFVDV